MTIYLVLYQISSTMFGYHSTFTDESEALDEVDRMNQTEWGMYYHFFVKVKKIGGE